MDSTKRLEHYDLEHLRVIQAEKELELMEIHEHLFKQEIKNISEITLRFRLMQVYKLIVTRHRVEKIYNMPMCLFMEKFYNGTITDEFK